jgi:glyoxylase-like metal-dependent hydrolase (beta-lactamase superfamily II)/8-oxo-dGTP pyrophosphatase MutT (NUDIX family)
LRDTAQGLEVLMTRRSLTASFAPGAFVFPGGGIDAADAQYSDCKQVRASQSGQQVTDASAAIRETFEELGVLLAKRADGSPCDAQDVARLNRHDAFWPQMSQHSYTALVDQVFWLAQWVTDRDLPRRFEVPFLVAPMPAGQEAVADEAEQFEPVWVRPADALARHEAGQFFIIFPTIRTLQRLLPFGTVADVLAACASEQPLWASCPRAGLLNGQDARYMEHEPPFGELQLVTPDGQIKHALDWQHERPVPLLRHVQRLTCGNPGRMTGPGTNSYIVGTPATGFAVIDPGPFDGTDAAHTERLADAVGPHLKAILCTHSHPDHSPGAKPLQALVQQRNGVTAPILGCASLPTARPGSAFTPDRELADGEVLRFDDPTSDLQVALGFSLQAVATPGHAANHLCFWLAEDGLLFTGDHVLNGSTTVVDPPDGHMGDYLASLDKLAALGAAFILPAHGYVLAPAGQAITQLKAHRLSREAKVKRVLDAHVAEHPAEAGSHDLSALADALLPQAYDDVPPAIWPVAKRSLIAHLERLRGR